jgi:hypothetical protein
MPDVPICILLIKSQAQGVHPLRETLSASGVLPYRLTQADRLSEALPLSAPEETSALAHLIKGPFGPDALAQAIGDAVANCEQVEAWS